MNSVVTTTVVALAALTLAVSAQAGTLAGTAEGVTALTSDGSFKMSGTYTDPSVSNGFGHYTGTYTEVTTGYTTCADPFGIFCLLFPNDIRSHCNVIEGQITFQSGMKFITVLFSTFLHALDVVCQLPGTTDRYVSLPLFNIWAPGESSSRGYGELSVAQGYMEGTSIPLRKDAYVDTFNTFSLDFG
jgi:hypothetical protein